MKIAEFILGVVLFVTGAALLVQHNGVGSILVLAGALTIAASFSK